MLTRLEQFVARLITTRALPSAALAVLVAIPAIAQSAWNATASLNSNRAYVGTTQHNGYVYATGGYDLSGNPLFFLSSVEFSRIQADGSLGQWQYTTSMLGPHFAHATVYANGFIYVLGGGPSSQSLLTVEAAPVNSDGTLGTWRQVGTLQSTGRYQHAAAVANGYIYAIGGSPLFGGCLNTVEHAQINADGSLGGFQYDNPLNVCTVGLRAVAANGHLYAVGGQSTTAVNYAVEQATINPDGSLGTWQYVSSLSGQRIWFGAEFASGRIYAFSGPNPPDNTSEEFSTVATDGSLSAWASTNTPLTSSLARLAGGSAGDGMHVYWIGGIYFNGTSSVSSNFVEYQTLGNTATGTGIAVQPTDTTTSGTPVSLTFSTVTQGGSTTLTTSSSGPPPPSGFKLGQPATYYNLSTSAVYSGPITICINYAGTSFTNPNNIAIWHYDTTLGSWTKLATTINTATTTACASTPSLSPFALFEIAYAAQVQQPINANGSSIFNGNKGVVPVKFSLMLNGLATCSLPPATIAVPRTAGGIPGAIDESVYTSSADSGSNFRIDSTSCQYVYNLASSSLGPGTYRVDILISGYVVGRGIFGIQ